jgi:hypothetical protein
MRRSAPRTRTATSFIHGGRLSCLTCCKGALSRGRVRSDA